MAFPGDYGYNLSLFLVSSKLVMGIFDLGWVRSAIYGLGLENFAKFFNFFPCGSKKKSLQNGSKSIVSEEGRPLIYCRSKVSSGRVGSGKRERTED